MPRVQEQPGLRPPTAPAPSPAGLRIHLDLALGQQAGLGGTLGLSLLPNGWADVLPCSVPDEKQAKRAFIETFFALIQGVH